VSSIDVNIPAAVATAIGARVSEPGPIPIAAGSTPKIIDSAVISTGRIRMGAACRIASSADRPSPRSWLA
jgi:hypothetical protein